MEAYVALGDPPPDALDASAWVFSALATAMRQVMLDVRLPERLRRQELRALARAMATLVPKRRLREAERAVRGEAVKQKAEVDPAVEAAPADEDKGK